jgi:hypothetical protein
MLIKSHRHFLIIAFLGFEGIGYGCLYFQEISLTNARCHVI